ALVHSPWLLSAHVKHPGTAWLGPARRRVHRAPRFSWIAADRTGLRNQAGRAAAARPPRNGEISAAATTPDGWGRVRFDGLHHHHRPVWNRDLSLRRAVHVTVHRARHDRHRHGGPLRPGDAAWSGRR